MVKAHIPLELHNIGPGEFRLMGAEIMLRVGAPIIIDERGFVVSRITFYGDNGTNFRIERQPDYDVLRSNNRTEGSADTYGLSIERHVKSTDGFLPDGDEYVKMDLKSDPDFRIDKTIYRAHMSPSYKYWFIETLDHTRWEKYRTVQEYGRLEYLHEKQAQARMEELSREWNVRLKEIRRDEISPKEYTSL